VKGHMGIDKNHCAYVALLASAPWNRFSDGCERNYRGVGKALMSIAVFYSAKHNNNPAVELHALSEAENFYRRIGMRETGRSKKNLKEFRLERSGALALIRPMLPHK